jgi:hypothetical protein
MSMGDLSLSVVSLNLFLQMFIVLLVKIIKKFKQKMSFIRSKINKSKNKQQTNPQTASDIGMGNINDRKEGCTIKSRKKKKSKSTMSS